MSVAVGILLAAVLAAAPEVRDDRAASAGIARGTLLASAPLAGMQPHVLAAMQPSHVPSDLILQALPPAPEIVTLQTSYFGTVTVDHRAHLARRITCKACHGPERVGKIEFTPRVAHERCAGCHRAEARGPTDCKGCHVKPAPSEPPATLTAEADAAKKPEEAPPTAPQAGTTAEGVAGADSEATLAAVSPSPSDDDPRQGFRQVVQVGYTAGDAVGPAFRLSSRHKGLAIEHSIDRLSRSGDDRTVILVGGGLVLSVQDRLAFMALGLGGIDAVQNPETGIMPALGARVGIEWLPRRWFLNSVQLSVTGVVDVANRRAMGREIGATNVYATLATGFSVGNR
jgi:hypothetical protein